MKPLSAAIVVMALLAAPLAKAEDGPTPAEIAAAKAATVSGQGLVDLFAQTCIAYAGNMGRLRLWLDAHMHQANERQTAYFLGSPNGSQQGKVWIQNSKIGNYAIVINDAMGLCTVKAERGPVGEVATYFKSTAAPKLKLGLEETSDSDGTFLGVAGRVVTYHLESGGDDYLIVLVGHDKHDIPLQSQMSLAASGMPK